MNLRTTKSTSGTPRTTFLGSIIAEQHSCLGRFSNGCAEWRCRWHVHDFYFLLLFFFRSTLEVGVRVSRLEFIYVFEHGFRG